MFADIQYPNSDLPVLVIGSAGLDVVGRVNSDLKSGSSTPSQIRYSFGGVARNVSENLARLGQKVILLTAVGRDHIGDQLIQQAEESGVNVNYIQRISANPTGSYIAILNSSGGLEFAMDDMRTTRVLTKEYIQRHADLFKGVSLLFLDSNLPQETIRTSITLAKREHLLICGDPTSVSLASKLKPYLKNIFLITPNNSEADILCDSSEAIKNRSQALVAAKELVSRGVKIAIITMAELGLCYATSETSGYIPAISTNILDPTGAGDALTSTVLFALLNKIPLDDAVRLGVSAASLTLRYQGAVVPDLTLEKLYDHLVM